MNIALIYTVNKEILFFSVKNTLTLLEILQIYFIFVVSNNVYNKLI